MLARLSPANSRAGCMHGLGGGEPCGGKGTEQRVVGGDSSTGVVVTLCGKHAEELDRDKESDEDSLVASRGVSRGVSRRYLPVPLDDDPPVTRK